MGSPDEVGDVNPCTCCGVVLEVGHLVRVASEDEYAYACQECAFEVKRE